MNFVRRILIVSFILLSFVSNAHALSLDEAKSQGWIGETASGYLETVKPGNPAAEAVKNEVNQKRRQKYSQISSQNGTALTVVEKLAGKKAIEISPAGHYVKGDNGSWVRK